MFFFCSMLTHLNRPSVHNRFDFSGQENPVQFGLFVERVPEIVLHRIAVLTGQEFKFKKQIVCYNVFLFVNYCILK